MRAMASTEGFDNAMKMELPAANPYTLLYDRGRVRSRLPITGSHLASCPMTAAILIGNPAVGRIGHVVCVPHIKIKMRAITVRVNDGGEVTSGRWPIVG